VNILENYARVAGTDVIAQLHQLATSLAGVKIVHVNSTRSGGGVAEILTKLIPLTRELGIDARWEIISGESEFFACTKGMHNALQGNQVGLSEKALNAYLETNRDNAERLRAQLEEADFVIIHDPQPAPLLH